VAGFIGSPAINFIPYNFLKEDSEYIINAESFKVKLPKDFHKAVSDYAGKEAIFGVRPEDFHDKKLPPLGKSR